MKMVSTSEVLDRHLKSFAEYDVDGVAADYSSDAVLFVPGGPLKGPDARNVTNKMSAHSASSVYFRSRQASRIVRAVSSTEAAQSAGTTSLPTVRHL